MFTVILKVDIIASVDNKPMLSRGKKMDTESEGRKMVMKNKISIVKVDESDIKAAIRKAINLYHTIQVFLSLT